ncbi:unnamed protein product [Heligmosomoides polygyrus]|uniref:Uncharacterized protein n=1 Tax=Heligmosomoides polygyrus TaxID=6339 RepID=A0A183F6M7_HELPZ|nr:unnamed protein product [Heligmosomoides polygyrus]
MATAKQRYDAVRPRLRVEFGGHRFVVPTLNFQVPKFRCCGGAHEGAAEPEPQTGCFDLSECANEVKSLIRTTSSGDQPPATTAVPMPPKHSSAMAVPKSTPPVQRTSKVSSVSAPMTDSFTSTAHEAATPVLTTTTLDSTQPVAKYDSFAIPYCPPTTSSLAGTSSSSNPTVSEGQEPDSKQRHVLLGAGKDLRLSLFSEVTCILIFASTRN